MLSGDRPRLLASVRNFGEALLAASLGAELIDLKEPAGGALGAVDGKEQVRIVSTFRTLAGRRPPISATVGDLPWEPAAIESAVRRTSAIGVDIVKFGVFARGAAAGDGLADLRRRFTTTPSGASLVVLLLVDRLGDFAEILDLARRALDVPGVVGVMLDTAAKESGAPRLGDLLSEAQLADFVGELHRLGALAGLAGSLRLEDIPRLVGTGADVLGFRGALCGGRRTDELDPRAFARVYESLVRLRASSSELALAS
jgi:uncharacterized protein (UPF0264 family)